MALWLVTQCVTVWLVTECVLPTAQSVSQLKFNLGGIWAVCSSTLVVAASGNSEPGRAVADDTPPSVVTAFAQVGNRRDNVLRHRMCGRLARLIGSIRRLFQGSGALLLCKCPLLRYLFPLLRVQRAPPMLLARITCSTSPRFRSSTRFATPLLPRLMLACSAAIATLLAALLPHSAATL